MAFVGFPLPDKTHAACLKRLGYISIQEEVTSTSVGEISGAHQMNERHTPSLRVRCYFTDLSAYLLLLPNSPTQTNPFKTLIPRNPFSKTWNCAALGPEKTRSMFRSSRP
ncbi:hypothetical protein ACLOJK_033316, partial [Asimina triloba]